MFDALLLDARAPCPERKHRFRSLRRYHNRSAILIITGKDQLADRIEALEQGVDDFLFHPFEIVAPERIWTHVVRTWQRSSRVIDVEDLELDCGNRMATRSGQAIELTDREFDLLEYLVVNAGKIVPRAEILERVYQSDPAEASNIVDVYVGYLRKKIEFPGCPRLLHTVRGRGYMIGVRSGTYHHAKAGE